MIRPKSQIEPSTFFKVVSILVIVVALSIILTDKSKTGKSNKKLGNFNKEYYQILDKSYAFTRNESDLKMALKASRTNDLDAINNMIMSGKIKTFPSGKNVILVKQWTATIIIKDPETGIEYYGVSESIK